MITPSMRIVLLDVYNDIPYLRRDGLHSQNLSDDEVEDRCGISVSTGRVTIADDSAAYVSAPSRTVSTCDASVGIGPSIDDVDDAPHHEPFAHDEEFDDDDRDGSTSELDDDVDSDESTGPEYWEDGDHRGKLSNLSKSLFHPLITNQ